MAPLQERRGRAAGAHGAPCNIARPHYCAGTPIKATLEPFKQPISTQNGSKTCVFAPKNVYWELEVSYADSNNGHSRRYCRPYGVR